MTTLNELFKKFNITSSHQKDIVEKINGFLADIYSYKDIYNEPDGLIDISAIIEGCFVSHSYKTTKLFPVNNNTASIGDIVVNINKDVFINVNKKAYSNKNKKFYNRGLYSISLDLDNVLPSNDLSDKEISDIIYNMSPFFRLLPPTYIIFSGNKGVHIYYLFNENIINKTTETKEVYDIFKKILPVDVTKCCNNKFLRVPYTINAKSGTMSRVVEYNKKYEFKSFISKYDEFINDYVIITNIGTYIKNIIKYSDYIASYGEDDFPSDEIIEKLKSVKIKSERKSVRIRDKKTNPTINNNNNLKMYYQRVLKLCSDNIKGTNGKLIGLRNNHLYCIGVAMFNLGYNRESTLNSLVYWNNQFISPISNRQLCSIVKAIYCHKYKIAATDIIDILNPCEWALEQCQINYTDMLKKDAKKRQNKKAALKKKKIRNFKHKQRIRIYNIRKYVQMTSLSYREIASALHISKSLVAYYIKKFNLLLLKNNLLTILSTPKKHIVTNVHKLKNTVSKWSNKKILLTS